MFGDLIYIKTIIGATIFNFNKVNAANYLILILQHGNKHYENTNVNTP